MQESRKPVLRRVDLHMYRRHKGMYRPFFRTNHHHPAYNVPFADTGLSMIEARMNTSMYDYQVCHALKVCLHII
jgi:hypothetical protein